tara:strand:- start:10006 stop:10326 length:321 start_codon:yes stop_codon:yes gene_type:complete
MSDDNIVEFPNNALVRTSSDVLTEQERSIKKKALINCLTDAIRNVEETDSITGGVCLLFEDDGTMHDSMGGDVSGTNLYVMLDKLKGDLMRIISDTMGYTNYLKED